ncbi:hypothetical protein SDJN02_25834, partial [Cucurbita argyrosperma subsp. argyrosperma]
MAMPDGVDESVGGGLKYSVTSNPDSSEACRNFAASASVNGHGRLRFDFYSCTQNSKLKKKMLISLSIQGLLDLFVAGISLVIGLGIFALIATILCSAAFLHSTKDVS